MGLAYVFYIAILAGKKQLSASALTKLWLPGLAIAVVVLNSYFFTELGFLRGQISHGTAGAAYPPLFGYLFVPSALPGVVGLQTLPPGEAAPYLDLTIVLAALMLVGVLIGCLISARRGAAAAVVLIAEAVVGVVLAFHNSDFGLFKLSMYIQPFLAAIVAIWLSGTIRRWVRTVAAAFLVVLIVAELSGQHAYVKASRNPGDVPNLSAADVIPAFHSLVKRYSGPIVSVTENPVLIKLEAATATGHPVYFQSRNIFSPFLREYALEIGGAKHVQAEHVLRAGSWASH